MYKLGTIELNPKEVIMYGKAAHIYGAYSLLDEAVLNKFTNSTWNEYPVIENRKVITIPETKMVEILPDNLVLHQTIIAKILPNNNPRTPAGMLVSLNTLDKMLPKAL